jgi:hypothetical protein
MPTYLDDAKDAIDDISSLGSSLKDAIALGKEQASTRDGVIQTINEMCDALQLASDLLAKELSASILEFNRIKGDKEEILRGFFERVAARFSEPTLRLLLHEGQVCGELHKLGDRFETPFSPEAVAAQNVWQAVKTFFTRSSRMSVTLHGLVEGERDYLRDFSAFLDDVRDRAEKATALSWGQDAVLRQHGDSLSALLREKRAVLQQKVANVRHAADAAIATLH